MVEMNIQQERRQHFRGALHPHKERYGRRAAIPWKLGQAGRQRNGLLVCINVRAYMDGYNGKVGDGSQE